MFKGRTALADSGRIRDSEIQGGRVGLYTFSQEKVIFSDLSVKCIGKTNVALLRQNLL